MEEHVSVFKKKCIFRFLPYSKFLSCMHLSWIKTLNNQKSFVICLPLTHIKWKKKPRNNSILGRVNKFFVMSTLVANCHITYTINLMKFLAFASFYNFTIAWLNDKYYQWTMLWTNLSFVSFLFSPCFKVSNFNLICEGYIFWIWILLPFFFFFFFFFFCFFFSFFGSPPA